MYGSRERLGVKFPGPTSRQLVGDYKNAGSDYRSKGCPDKVKVHDFVDPAAWQGRSLTASMISPPMPAA